MFDLLSKPNQDYRITVHMIPFWHFLVPFWPYHAFQQELLDVDMIWHDGIPQLSAPHLAKPCHQAGKVWDATFLPPRVPIPPKKKNTRALVQSLHPVHPLHPLLNFSSSHLFKLPSFNKCSRNCRMLPLNTSAGSEEAKLFDAKITWHPKVEFMEDVKQNVRLGSKVSRLDTYYAYKNVYNIPQRKIFTTSKPSHSIDINPTLGYWSHDGELFILTKGTPHNKCEWMVHSPHLGQKWLQGKTRVGP